MLIPADSSLLCRKENGVGMGMNSPYLKLLNNNLFLEEKKRNPEGI